MNTRGMKGVKSGRSEEQVKDIIYHAEKYLVNNEMKQIITCGTDSIEYNNIKMIWICPSNLLLNNQDANKRSIVTLIEITDIKKRLLFTGDAYSEDILEGLKQKYCPDISEDIPLELDYMEVPHHGAYSNYSNDESILGKFFSLIKSKNIFNKYKWKET